MASAFYKHILKADGTPVSASPTRALQTSKQISDYLLCTVCEGRFNKGGEEWVLENYYRLKGSFPIQESLLKVDPHAQHDRSVYYKGDSIKGVDLDKLIYFALSVFWRAGAHRWKCLDKTVNLSLGKYEEELREFLLDQKPFPEDMALNILISPSKTPQDGIIFPHTYKHSPFHCHGFSIPGMVFALPIGKAIPKGAKEECAFHSRMVLLTDMADEFALSGKKKLAAKHKKK